MVRILCLKDLNFMEEQIGEEMIRITVSLVTMIAGKPLCFPLPLGTMIAGKPLCFALPLVTMIAGKPLCFALWVHKLRNPAREWRGLAIVLEHVEKCSNTIEIVVNLEQASNNKKTRQNLEPK